MQDPCRRSSVIEHEVYIAERVQMLLDRPQIGCKATDNNRALVSLLLPAVWSAARRALIILYDPQAIYKLLRSRVGYLQPFGGATTPTLFHSTPKG